MLIKLNDGTPLAESPFNLVQPCTDQIPVSFGTPQDYNQYLLYCLKQNFTDNLFFYRIPVGLKVYGDQRVMNQKPVSFYLNRLDVASDVVHEFVFVQPVDVVALNVASNLDVLSATAIGAKKKVELVFKDLLHISKYLCSLSYKGFITPPNEIHPYMIHICDDDETIIQQTR